MKLHWIFNRYLAPAGDEAGGATTIDRGDDFVPTGPDADPKAPPKVEVTAEDLTKVPEVKPKATVLPATGDEADIDPDNPDGDAADATKPKGKDTRIPLARHEKILARERTAREAAERQLAQTRQATQVAATNEQVTAAETKLLGLEREYAKLVNDGKYDEAATKMGEIRLTERTVTEARTTFAVQAAEARAYERVQYDSTVQRLEEAYSVLNEDHADFDADLMAEVVELRDGYIATGKYSRAQAIKKAAETLVGAATVRQKAAVETEVRVDKADVAKAAAAERAAAQRAKNGKVAATQPPSTAGVGADHDKMGGVVTAEAVIKMKHDEFVKLPEADLARLRGDEL